VAKYEGFRGDGTKIEVSAPSDKGQSSPTGAELMAAGKEPSSPTPEISGSKFGDPNAPKMEIPKIASRFNPRTGMPDIGFYGHYLPSHFKKTSIINTKGRVR
jgi:hypothetical protein